MGAEHGLAGGWQAQVGRGMRCASLRSWGAMIGMSRGENRGQGC